MGLDIEVRKPINNLTSDNFIIIDDTNKQKLNIFNKYFFEKEIEYFNIEKELLKYNLKIDDVVECYGQHYNGNKVDFTYFITNHELYQITDYLSKIKNIKQFNTKIELFKDKSFSWLRKYNSLLLKYKFNFNFKDGNYYSLNPLLKFIESKVKIKIKNPEIILVKETCLAYKEVGYQRKGANNKFYEDEMWSSDYIVDKNTLLEHQEKYFSYNTPESKGGFGSGVEFELSDEDMKNRFKENIIDNFIEGETFVCYC